MDAAPAPQNPIPDKPGTGRVPTSKASGTKIPAASPETVEDFLRESGEVKQELIEIAARDVERSLHHEQRLAAEKAGKRESFYSDLVFTLTNLRYEEQEARVLWVNLLTHKMEMSDRLGRNVGIRVAALDYFKNIIGALDEVKIIDASTYIETAQLAVTDGLTGVFNHRYFQDRLIRDINRAKDEGGQVSLLMIDIDYFKQYNDVNGHIAGDVALKEVASVLRRNLKKDDLVARYGGEEFAVILAGLDRDRASLVAERVRSVIGEIDFPNEKVLPGGNLTVSIGLAECPSDATERGDLISAADRALYSAKHSGKNRICLAPADQRRDARRTVLMKTMYRHSENLDETPLEAQTLNLSLGGAAILVSSPVATGQILHLNFGPDVQVLGRVVWISVQSDGCTQVGIKFVSVGATEAQGLQSILQSHQ